MFIKDRAGTSQNPDNMTRSLNRALEKMQRAGEINNTLTNQLIYKIQSLRIETRTTKNGIVQISRAKTNITQHESEISQIYKNFFSGKNSDSTRAVRQRSQAVERVLSTLVPKKPEEILHEIKKQLSAQGIAEPVQQQILQQQNKIIKKQISNEKKKADIKMAEELAISENEFWEIYGDINDGLENQGIPGTAKIYFDDMSRIAEYLNDEYNQKNGKKTDIKRLLDEYKDIRENTVRKINEQFIQEHMVQGGSLDATGML